MGRGVVCIIIYCKTTELTETDDKADGWQFLNTQERPYRAWVTGVIQRLTAQRTFHSDDIALNPRGNN